MKLLQMLGDPKAFDPAFRPIHHEWVRRGLRDEVNAPGSCAKYVVTKEVLDLAHQLQEQIPFPQLGSKGDECWLEFQADLSQLTNVRKPGDTFDRVRAGALVPSGQYLLLFVTTCNGRWFHAVLSHSLQRFKMEYVVPDDMSNAAEALSYIFARIISLIQSPRATERRPVVVDEKLQRSRVRSGKPRIPDHSEVVIHVTKAEGDDERAAAEHEARTGKRLHHVRAFYRVKRGKVERVRAHWRGDGSIGTKATTGYKVKL